VQYHVTGDAGIGCNDLDQALIEQVDVGGQPSDAAGRKTLQHRIFQQSGGILDGDPPSLSWRRTVSIRASCSITGARRSAERVGMMATKDAIMPASSRSFLARTPLALANCLSLNGLTWRTDMPAASAVINHSVLLDSSQFTATNAPLGSNGGPAWHMCARKSSASKMTARPRR
jgi:hypothetical protein